MGDAGAAVVAAGTDADVLVGSVAGGDVGKGTAAAVVAGADSLVVGVGSVFGAGVGSEVAASVFVVGVVPGSGFAAGVA